MSLSRRELLGTGLKRVKTSVSTRSRSPTSEASCLGVQMVAGSNSVAPTAEARGLAGELRRVRGHFFGVALR